MSGDLTQRVKNLERDLDDHQKWMSALDEAMQGLSKDIREREAEMGTIVPYTLDTPQKRLRVCLAALHMEKQQLAKKVGVSNRLIGYFTDERFNRQPSLALAEDIGFALGADHKWIFKAADLSNTYAFHAEDREVPKC